MGSVPAILPSNGCQFNLLTDAGKGQKAVGIGFLPSQPYHLLATAVPRLRESHHTLCVQVSAGDGSVQEMGPCRIVLAGGQRSWR